MGTANSAPAGRTIGGRPSTRTFRRTCLVSPRRIQVLHLVGADEDTGGVLSVIRNIQAATVGRSNHTVWVHQRFRQTRAPELHLQFTRHLLMETPNFVEFLTRGFRAFLELRKLLQNQ